MVGHDARGEGVSKEVAVFNAIAYPTNVAQWPTLVRESLLAPAWAGIISRKRLYSAT
jgi:hypothetical protein